MPQLNKSQVSPSRLPRILLVIPSVASARLFLNQLIEELAGTFEVHCACSMTENNFNVKEHESSRVVCHHIPFPRGMNIFRHILAALLVRNLIKKVQPVLIHAHFSAGIFTTALALSRKRPVAICTFQGLSFPLMTSRARALLMRVAEGYAARQFDSAWVLSEDDCVALKRVSPRALVLAQPGFGLGCELQRFDSRMMSDVDRNVLRRKLGISEDDFVFIFIGRYVHFKGFDLSVRAFLRLASSCPHAKLLLVGARDPLHASGLCAAEETAWQESSQVIDIGWTNSIEHYLAIAHASVFPSEREGMPVSLMETLSMGVPVITFDSRGCRDVVRNGIDGIVLNDRAVDCLEQTMKIFIQDVDVRNRMKAAALAGRDRFCRKHFVSTQIGIYQDALRVRESGQSIPICK
jgi:glycosyltransferase involved in cell wall biosynthesis